MQGLADVFVFDLRVFQQTFGTVRIKCSDFEGSPHSDSEVPQTRLPVHDIGIRRDAIDRVHGFKMAPIS